MRLNMGRRESHLLNPRRGIGAAKTEAAQHLHQLIDAHPQTVGIQRAIVY